MGSYCCSGVTFKEPLSWSIGPAPHQYGPSGAVHGKGQKGRVAVLTGRPGIYLCISMFLLIFLIQELGHIGVLDYRENGRCSLQLGKCVPN